MLRFKHGWGNCSHCGRDVGATKTGLAVRHGFIRVRKAKRTLFPKVPVGTDAHNCKGSGKPVRNWFVPNYESEK